MIVPEPGNASRVMQPRDIYPRRNRLCRGQPLGARPEALLLTRFCQQLSA
jgi:hypothetical protein